MLAEYHDKISRNYGLVAQMKDSETFDRIIRISRITGLSARLGAKFILRFSS